MFVDWPLLNNPWFQLFYSLPAYLLGFYVFGKSALHSVKNGDPNMDVLIITGVTSAFVYSLWGTLMHGGEHAHHFLFYETGTTIISLVLLGNLIEKRSVKQTTRELNALQNLRVQLARRVEQHGDHEHIQEVRFEEIRKDQVFVVNEGDKIPIDGIVIRGEALVNESFVTGEALAISKQEGSAVISGTLLEQGSVYIRSTVGHQQAFISRVIDLLKKAQADKPAIQRISDRAGALFVQVVLVIALVTVGINYFFADVSFNDAMMRGIAVLVISCPCAMGLATPTAVMVGMGKLAKQGILVSKAGAIEAFAKANTFIFDKTGTLTSGKFRFTFFNHSTFSDAELKHVIYQLEKFSSHPIAKAVMEQQDWASGDVQFDQPREIKGVGVIGTDRTGVQWKLGSPGILTAAFRQDADLYLTRNEIVVATLRLEDELREGAAEAVAYFNSRGSKTVLLSGDAADKCERFAKETGITQVYSRQTPEDKLRRVDQYQSEGIVAMTGDGINDAPALSKAAVAVSFGNASDLAQQSAQIILMGKQATDLIQAHAISVQTYQTIKQNLFWAFAYNVVAIPLAAAGFMHPMLAAASMAFSDVVVIGNAIRIRYTKVRR